MSDAAPTEPRAPSLRQRLLAGGSWVIVGKAVTAVANVLVLSLVARILSTSGFAVFGTAQRLVTIGSRMAPMGLHQAAVRMIAEARGTGRPGRARTVVRKVLVGTTIGAAVVVGLLYAGVGSWLIGWLSDSTALAVSVSALAGWMIVLTYQVVVSESFRGFQDLRRASMYGGVYSGVATLVVLGLLRWTRGSLEVGQVVLVMSLCIGLSTAFGLMALRRRALEMGPAEPIAGREVARLSLPIWVSGVTVFALTQSDVLIVRSFLADADVASYYGAARLVDVVSQPLILINLVVPPFIAELYFRGEKERLQRILRQAATMAGVPAFLVLLAFVLFGGPILGIVLSDELRSGATVLAILSVGKLVNVLTGSCGITMNMTGHQTPLMLITLATGFVTVVVSLLAVGPYGGTGVAVAVSGGLVMQNLAMWLATRHYTGLWTHVGLPRWNDLRALLRRPRA